MISGVSMRGTIKTFLPEKQYGFIQGDDGKDYFFHQSSFKSIDQQTLICDDAAVEFDQKATPKGYKADNCALVNSIEGGYYIEPNQFLISKSSEIKGWEIIEKGDWIVNGSSRDGSDAAKQDMIASALAVRANALINVSYQKTTGEDGNYRFTIHNYRGKIVTIAKKSAKGTLIKEQLTGLNIRAECKKNEMNSINAQIRKKAEKEKWIILASGVVAGFGGYLTHPALLPATLIVVAILFARIGQELDGSWLHRG